MDPETLRNKYVACVLREIKTTLDRQERKILLLLRLTLRGIQCSTGQTANTVHQFPSKTGSWPYST